MRAYRFASGLTWKAFLASPRVRGPMRMLRAYDSQTLKERKAFIIEGLRNLLRFYADYDFAPSEWKKVSLISDPDHFMQAWRDIPLTTKADLRHQLAPERLKERGISGRIGSSSGSTGHPVSFLHDKAMLRAISAGRLYAKLRRGWTPGMPIVGVWGSERDLGVSRRPILRAANWIRRVHLIGAYHLKPDLVDELARLTKRMPNFALYGFSSMLGYVAREVLRRGDRSFHGRIATAWNGGEPLLGEEAEVFEQAFGTPLLNHYGSREMGGIAFQPNSQEPLAVLRPLVFVEVIREDGRDAAPGELGKIVCTSLACRGTPFIRYEIGDMGTVAQDGRDLVGVTHLSQVHGRTTETITLPNNVQVHGIFWAGLARAFPEIEEYQVRWGAAKVEILLVAPRMSEPRRLELQYRAQAMLGDLPCCTKRVPRVPRSEQGKLLRVVRDPSLDTT